MKIAVLGAPGSGKTQLTNELAQHFLVKTTTDCVVNVVVVDAPPLMAALYAGLLDKDPTRYAIALAGHRNYDLTLVCGLDIPCSKSKQQDAGSLSREAVDARLRAVLADGGSAYAVIYGQGPARMDAAIKAISSLQGDRFDSSAKKPKHWQWACEKCSDPECEQRMFTGRLNIGHR
jgi:nicotinamide riboside kinase